MSFIGIIAGRWGPGPESAGATGDAGQARAGPTRKGGGPDQVWCDSSWRTFRHFRHFRRCATPADRSVSRDGEAGQLAQLALPRYPSPRKRAIVFRGRGESPKPGLGGQKCRCHRHRIGPNGWDCLGRVPLFSPYFKRYRQVTNPLDLANSEEGHRYFPVSLTVTSSNHTPRAEPQLILH